jgi:hypothetical protein
MRHSLLLGFALWLTAYAVPAQRTVWRQATPAELTSVLPSRATIENEHIETEIRSSSGIVDNRGRFIAGAVLITAGYSAEGKYSHYLIVQVPVDVGGIALKPGDYAFGWNRVPKGDALSVHFNEAATGRLIGTARAHIITGSHRVETLHIWPPDQKSLIQIGRFGVPYSIHDK